MGPLSNRPELASCHRQMHGRNYGAVARMMADHMHAELQSRSYQRLQPISALHVFTTCITACARLHDNNMQRLTNTKVSEVRHVAWPMCSIRSRSILILWLLILTVV